jgi:hypothetical protein
MVLEEKSASQWLHEMANAGFDGTVIATNHDGTIYKGNLVEDGEKIAIQMRRVKTQDEVKNRLQALKNKSIV